jgi:peptidoglycan LD-endopeptidase CwlK
MSFVFSRRSKKNLETCEIPLQTLATKALATSPIDFTIICGYRGKKDQDKAFSSGASKLKFPNSKHNKWPALGEVAIPRRQSLMHTKCQNYLFCYTPAART